MSTTERMTVIIVLIGLFLLVVVHLICYGVWAMIVALTGEEDSS